MDLQKNRLAIGAVVLLLLLGVAVWQIRARQGEQEQITTAEPEGDLPEIDKDEITSLEITTPGEEGHTVRLAKVDNTWRVVAPLDAPADEATVRTALEKLDELEVQRVAASNADNYERLEVDEAHAVRVIAKKGEEIVANLLIGAFGGGSTMVRVDGETEVLAVRGSIKFAFNKELKEWRDREIVDVATSDVRDVTVTNEHGTFHFARGAAPPPPPPTPPAEGETPPPPPEPPATDAWGPAPEQAAIERFSASKVQTLVSSFTRLRATDFAATDVTADRAGLTTPAATVTMVVQPEAPEGEGDGEHPPTTPPPAPETIVLELGGPTEAGGSQFYLRRRGDDTIFVVTQFVADKLKANTDAFQEAEPGSEPPEGEMPEMPEGMPMGMPGGGMPGGGPGGPGGGQIPPEIMRQIQEQLQKQQGGGAPPPH